MSRVTPAVKRVSPVREQDPYERLWCVYELDVALDVKDAYEQADDERGSTFVIVEFSQRAWDVYRGRIIEWSQGEAERAGISVDEWERRGELGPEYAYYRSNVLCEEAACGREEDTAMIRGKVEAKEGGWERLNDRMARFRRPRAADLPVALA